MIYPGGWHGYRSYIAVYNEHGDSWGFDYGLFDIMLSGRGESIAWIGWGVLGGTRIGGIAYGALVRWFMIPFY